MKFGVKFWWNFPCYVFQGLGVQRKISPTFHVKSGVKNRKFHADFTLLGRSTDLFPVLPFLDFLVFIKENPQIYQGFSFLAEPTNSLEKEEKTPK